MLKDLIKKIDDSQAEYLLLPAQLLVGVVWSVLEGQAAPLEWSLGIYGGCTLLLAWGRAWAGHRPPRHEDC